ncbi:MAG TPA: three-Cys-motif partner protein TcmP [Verrucomicrobiota bacterium]|nr:three-Cys-motif partner protein TcmP [Verrucomicrobiota bacterium]
MATPKETLWEMDPHTGAKHEILRRYLAAWFPILSTHHPRIIYIDGFSGPGRYKNGEPGSPMIALDVALNHPKKFTGKIVFYFIEEQEDRLAHLRQELDGKKVPENFRVICESGRFHEKIGELLDSLEADGETLAPTFAFIDPFGFSGIPLYLIERLLKCSRCETLITFMVDSFNRFLEHPDDSVVRHIADALGGPEAIAIAKGTGNRLVKLRELYQSKLQKVAKYVRYFEMRDRQDRTQYYLFFATNNIMGLRKMKDAMWKVDPNGDFRFSDATNPSQLVLLENDPKLLLAHQLCERFTGKGLVTGKRVLSFVETRTAFRKTHLTAVLKMEEKSARIRVDGVKTNGKPRKPNTFPDDVRLEWV